MAFKKTKLIGTMSRALDPTMRRRSGGTNKAPAGHSSVGTSVPKSGGAQEKVPNKRVG